MDFYLPSFLYLTILTEKLFYEAKFYFYFETNLKQLSNATALFSKASSGMGPWGPTAINSNEIGDSWSEIFYIKSWEQRSMRIDHKD